MIDTERLLLRKLCKEDASGLFRYRSDKVVNFYQGWIPETEEDAEVFIDKIAEKPDMPGTWFQLGVIKKSKSELIGDIGIHFLESDANGVELGCTLDKKYHGKGYASEALTAVIDYLFSELNKERIYAYILKENINSIRLFRRLGFIQKPDEDGYMVYQLCFGFTKKP